MRRDADTGERRSATRRRGCWGAPPHRRDDQAGRTHRPGLFPGANLVDSFVPEIGDEQVVVAVEGHVVDPRRNLGHKRVFCASGSTRTISLVADSAAYRLPPESKVHCCRKGQSVSSVTGEGSGPQPTAVIEVVDDEMTDAAAVASLTLGVDEVLAIMWVVQSVASVDPSAGGEVLCADGPRGNCADTSTRSVPLGRS